MFDYAWQSPDGPVEQRAVARLAPAGEGLFPEYNLKLEAAVMEALRRTTSTPIPRVLFCEWDTSILGVPFIVMEHVSGQVAADDPPFTTEGWVLELDDSQRARMWDNGLRALVEVHSADLAALDIDEIDIAGDALGRQIEYWERYLQWAAAGVDYETIEAGLDYVKANVPQDAGPVVLSWGDSRLGNILFAADQSVAAVLDWEMVSAAPRELDLAWWLFIVRHHTEGIGAPVPGGFPTAEQTVARYEELSGQRLQDLHYYEVFAALRLSIMLVRAASLLIDAGVLPADAPLGRVNPASKLLAELIGAEQPAGEAAHYFGNR
jgi:aminoglycoside phosphotransferase (APT) family kinase protein